MTKVSVVLPIYKPQREYLLDIIKNLNRQNLDLILIISDDHNLSKTILKEIVDKANFEVRYVLNRKKGIFRNLNNALRQVSTDYVQLICQDDIPHRNLLVNQIEFIEKNNLQVCFCQFDLANSRGDIIQNEYLDKNKILPSIIEKKEINNYLIRYGSFVGNLSPLMIKYELIQKLEYFSEEFEFIGDIEFISRLNDVSDLGFNKSTLLTIRHHKNRASLQLGIQTLIIEKGRLFKDLIEKSKKSYLNYILFNKKVGSEMVIHCLASKALSRSNLFILNRYPYNPILYFPFVLGEIIKIIYEKIRNKILS